MRRVLLLCALAAAAGCSSSSVSGPLKPAAEVEASRMAPIEFGKATKVGKLTITVNVPVPVADVSGYYGAKSWSFHIRAENATSADTQMARFQVRCDDGATSGGWAGATISDNDNVPAGSFLEGDADLSARIDDFGDPPKLHDCRLPRLLIGDHLSAVLP